MLVTIKQRAYPTPNQQKLLFEWDHTMRAVHNAALQERRENYLAYKRTNKPQEYVNYVSQANQLPAIKREVGWVRSVPAQVLQQMLKHLDKNCNKHGLWRVKYWSKHQHKPTYHYPTPKQTPHTKVEPQMGTSVFTKVGLVEISSYQKRARSIV